MHTGVSSYGVVWQVFFERYTRVLLEASPEFPIHFLKIYITLLSRDKVVPALERVAALLLITGLSFSAACLTIKRRSIFFT
jgi:hypothetical protein